MCPYVALLRASEPGGANGHSATLQSSAAALSPVMEPLLDRLDSVRRPGHHDVRRPARLIGHGSFWFKPDRSPEPDSALVCDLRIDSEPGPASPSLGSTNHLSNDLPPNTLSTNLRQQDEIHPAAVAIVSYVQLHEPDGTTGQDDEEALNVGITRSQVLSCDFGIGELPGTTPAKEGRLIK